MDNEDLELETTNSEEVVEDTTDEVEESTEEIVEGTTPEVETTQPEKTFTQSEVNELLRNRAIRERKKVERENRQKDETLAKLEELAYLNQKGLNVNSLDEALDKSRAFYGQQGIVYNPSTKNTRDEEILARADAEEIIDSCVSNDELETEISRLSRKANLNSREKLILDNLNSELTIRKGESELRSIGVTDEEINSSEFKEFRKKFDKSTPIKEVYELYRQLNKPHKVVENPGSLKTTTGKTEKAYFTEEELEKLTPEQLDDPVIWEKAIKSMTSKK